MTPTPAGCTCDICEGGRVEDPNREVTISLPEGGMATATCGQWAAFGCSIFRSATCTSYQNALKDCCTTVAPPNFLPTPTPFSPTPSPTRMITNPPTAEPETFPPTSEPGCVNFTVSFEQDQDGRDLRGGECLEDDYSSLGLTLSSSTVPGIPCLLDSSEESIENTAQGRYVFARDCSIFF